MTDTTPWRLGRHYEIHAYRGDIPVATFATVADARLAVRAVNELNRVGRTPPQLPLPTLGDIVSALGEVYTEDGVALWLFARNSHFDRQQPIRLCTYAAGRVLVHEHVESLVGGAVG